MIDDNLQNKINAMLGGNHEDRHMISQLKIAAKKAKQIDIVVSFLRESGAKLIIEDLKEAVNNGTKIRLLTSDYLGISEPSAMYYLRNALKDNLDLRIYPASNRSFHIKAYIFHYDDSDDIFIGSSNISKSALTYGFEWNYRLNSKMDKDSYDVFYDEFKDLFYNHSLVVTKDVLKTYSRNYIKPKIVTRSIQYPFVEEVEEEDALYKKEEKKLFEPRGVQIEALCGLQEKRNQGCDKALVQAACGVGKTAIAGFDARNMHAKRVLFVAHRIEILKQAEETFRNILGDVTTGFFGNGMYDTNKDCIFASVSTLGKTNYLNASYFSKDYFDYIVIDEFHHAVTDCYTNIIDYFEPKFLLGLTATPNRMDGKDIYKICDYNVAYAVDLFQAINRGMLTPFHYYGIYDSTNYDGLKLHQGKYLGSELTELYEQNKKRNDLIYGHYRKYNSKAAMGFCITRKHAELMAEDFNKRGIKAVACYSDASKDSKYFMERSEAISKMANGEISVIFTVDMFNEGVDIPCVDMVMFLRPTESEVVFLQQLGRGLRLSRGKQYLNVLDFIGNYKRANDAPILLSKQDTRDNSCFISPDPFAEGEKVYPVDCFVDFDLATIQLFEMMRKRSMKKKDYIDEDFKRVMDSLGHIPTRMELFLHMDDRIYRLCKANAKLNIFKDYLEYLHEHKLLTPDEKQLFEGVGYELIHTMEVTAMSKVYKMPVLQAFYNNGNIVMELSEEQLLQSWKDFFSTGNNWMDLISKKVKTKEDVLGLSDKEHLRNIMSNPVKFLIKSSKGVFVEKDGYAIALNDQFKTILDNPALKKHMLDVIEYRMIDYYSTRYEEEYYID